MKIYIGTDHAGFELKEKLVPFLREELNYDVEDMGAHEYDEDDDDPDLVRPVAAAVARDQDEEIDSRGIILGGSGQGEAIVANREQGVRAAVYYGGPDDLIVLSRDHNNANVLSLGARFLTTEEAKHAIKVWLATPFIADERHARRIEKIDPNSFA